MSQPHDGLFKFTFSQPENARSILQTALPKPIARHIDWTSLTPALTHFVNPELRQQHADVVFRAQIAGRDAYLHILFEHQRDSEHLMPYRLLRYSIDIWQAHLREHPKATRLPPVLPVVLHHSKGGWRGPTRLSQCWDLHPDLLPDIQSHLPELCFILDDLSHQADQALLERAQSDLAKLVLLAFRNLPNHPRPFDVLNHLAAIIKRVYRAPGGIEAFRAVLSYASQVAELDLDELRDYIEMQIDDQDVEAVMGMTSRQLIEQSKAEGRAQGKVELLLRLLGKRFGPLPEDTKQRVRHAAPTELDTWADQIVDAKSLDEALR